MSSGIAAQPLLEADDLVRWDYVFSPYFLVLTIAELGVVTIIGDARDDELLAVVCGRDVDVVGPVGISLATAGVRAAAFSPCPAASGCPSTPPRPGLRAPPNDRHHAHKLPRTHSAMTTVRVKENNTRASQGRFSNKCRRTFMAPQRRCPVPVALRDAT